MQIHRHKRTQTERILSCGSTWWIYSYENPVLKVNSSVDAIIEVTISSNRGTKTTSVIEANGYQYLMDYLRKYKPEPTQKYARLKERKRILSSCLAHLAYISLIPSFFTFTLQVGPDTNPQGVYEYHTLCLSYLSKPTRSFTLISIGTLITNFSSTTPFTGFHIW